MSASAGSHNSAQSATSPVILKLAEQDAAYIMDARCWHDSGLHGTCRISCVQAHCRLDNGDVRKFWLFCDVPRDGS